MPSIHLRSFSTDHHLQRLLDLEELTPRNSPLRRLHELRVPPTITYEYVSDPYSASSCAARRRQSRLVRLGERLQVVLANLRGVSDRADMLRRDNIRTLSDARAELKGVWALIPEHGIGVSRSPITHGRGSAAAEADKRAFGHKSAEAPQHAAAADSKRVLGERNQNPAARQIRAKLKADRKRWDAYVKFKREGPTSPDPRDGEQWE